MIPKRQHMEQTTEGTISYLLSISWSHFRSASAKPRSWLVEVMSATFRRGAEAEGTCRDNWVSGPHPLKRINLQRGGVERWSGGEWRMNKWKRRQRRERLLITHFKYTAVSADGAVSMHYDAGKRKHLSKKKNAIQLPSFTWIYSKEAATNCCWQFESIDR